MTANEIYRQCNQANKMIRSVDGLHPLWNFIFQNSSALLQNKKITWGDNIKIDAHLICRGSSKSPHPQPAYLLVFTFENRQMMIVQIGGITNTPEHCRVFISEPFTFDQAVDYLLTLESPGVLESAQYIDADLDYYELNHFYGVTFEDDFILRDDHKISDNPLF